MVMCSFQTSERPQYRLLEKLGYSVRVSQSRVLEASCLRGNSMYVESLNQGEVLISVFGELN
jgi:hypothetical protein